MKKSTLLKLAVSAIFFVVLARVVDGKALAEVFREVNLLYLSLSVAISFVMVALSCLKWQFLLRLQGHSVRFLTLYRYYFIGYYFSNLLPSSVGGDLVRSWYGGRKIGSQSDAAVSVFIERFTGALFLLPLALLAPFLVPGLYRDPAVQLTLFGAAGLLLLLLFLMGRGEPVERLRSILNRCGFRRGLPARLEKILAVLEGVHEKLMEALRVLRTRRGALPGVALYTLLFYLATWINIYLSFRAFGVDPGFARVVAVTPVAMMVAMVPIAPLGSLGLAEGAFVYFFGLTGIPKQAALAMSLLVRVKLMLLGAVGLLCHLREEGKGVGGM